MNIYLWITFKVYFSPEGILKNSYLMLIDIAFVSCQNLPDNLEGGNKFYYVLIIYELY